MDQINLYIVIFYLFLFIINKIEQITYLIIIKKKTKLSSNKIFLSNFELI